MEFALLLRALWSRKWLVALGVLVALRRGGSPGRSRLLSPGAQEPITVLRDGADAGHRRRAGLVARRLGTDLNPLIVRAGVYSRLLTSPEVSQRRPGGGHRSGPHLRPGAVETNQPRAEQEPTAEQRSSQIVGETNSYRLQFESSPELPIITIFAQAPTTDGANRLATGAAQGLAGYVRQLQVARLVPAAQRVGDPASSASPPRGRSNSGVGKRIGVLIFILVFVAWCRSCGAECVSRLVQLAGGAAAIAEHGGGGGRPRAERREPRRA